jgi:hypothetical protein
MKKTCFFLFVMIFGVAHADEWEQECELQECELQECELCGWDYWWNKECKGRIDAGPAYASIDMLESGHTKRTLNLPAVKIDASLMIYKGLCLKPSFLIAWGKASLNGSGVGVGFCIPLEDYIGQKITITPSIGVNETRFKSRINFPDFDLFHLRERFVSRGYYFAVDGSWTFSEKWRVYAFFQYSWSRVHTQVRPLFRTKNSCKGPNYALSLERDLSEHFSVCLAAGYNISLSKEKHGLRGKGVKLGLVYWY